MITEFTGGDTRILSKLMELGQFEGTDQKWKEKQRQANHYVEQALDFYFSQLGMDPFQEEMA